MSKRCKKCDTTKPVSEFGNNCRTPDGLQTKCFECTRAYQAEYYARNKDKVLAINAKWRNANLDSVRQHQREYDANNPDRIRRGIDRLADWNRDNPEKSRARIRQWKKTKYSADRLYTRLQSGSQKARRLGLPVDEFTSEDLLAHWRLVGIDPTKCFYTGEPLGDDWELDHAYPLKRVGTPGHVVSNLVPCSQFANRSKGRLTADEYLLEVS